MTRHESREVRRQQILSALMRVIARDGVAAVSVRTVAAEAGLSPSALRYHFSSQESLLAAPAVASLHAAIRAPGDYDLPDPSDRLAAAIEQFVPLAPSLQPSVKALYGTVVAGFAMPAVASSVAEMYAHTRYAIADWLGLHAPDATGDTLDVDEIMTLIDGLSLGLLVGNTTPAVARRLIAHRAHDILHRHGMPPADA